MRKIDSGWSALAASALAHTSQNATAAATKCSLERVPYPLYFSDLAPLDFYLYPNLKTNLRGGKFGSNEGIVDAVYEYFGDQEECFYLQTGQRWKKSDSRQREIILRNNVTICSWSFPKYTGRKLFYRPSYLCRTELTHIMRVSLCNAAYVE